MPAPTIVLQEVSTSDEETGYRVLLARGADIFGEWDEHVAETFVSEEDSLDEAVQELRQQLKGGAEEEPVEEDHGPLDHDDVDDLRRAFEEHDTIKAAAERFELGYGAVRQRMIDAGIYEPRSYDTGDDEEDDEEVVYITRQSGYGNVIHAVRDCPRLTGHDSSVWEKPRSVLEPHKDKCQWCWSEEELPDEPEEDIDEDQEFEIGDEETVLVIPGSRRNRFHSDSSCRHVSKSSKEPIEKSRAAIEGLYVECGTCWSDDETVEDVDEDLDRHDVDDLESVYKEEDGNIAAVARRFDVRYQYIYRDLVDHLIHEPNRSITSAVEDQIAGRDDEDDDANSSPLAGDDSPHKYSTGKSVVARDYSKLPESKGTLRGLDVKVPDDVTADGVRAAVWSGECRTILEVAEHVGLDVDGAGRGLGAMRTILHRLDLYDDLQDPEGYELPEGVTA